MTLFKHGDVFFGSNTSWANMVVTASLEVLRTPPKPLNICRTKTRGKGYSQYIHNNKVINVFKALRKAINVFKANMESNK
jgi:hypothetical protein